MLSLANCASPPPSPCSRVHQTHLNPSLPAPQSRRPSPSPVPAQTPGLTTSCPASSPALRTPHLPLTQSLSGQCGPADLGRGQSWAEGSSPRELGWLSEGTLSLGHSQILVPCSGGPRLPLGVAGGCRVSTQAPELLFVQAKVSLPPPSQPGLDQWPRAMARVSGPCPLWPVAPGSMGLLPGLGPHCD